MFMNIGFIGLGKLGLPVALSVEDRGHRVFGYDPNPQISQFLSSKSYPFKEPHVSHLLEKSKLNITSRLEVIKNSDIIFVAVQTPHDNNFEGVSKLTDERKDFDYSFLIQAIKDISLDVESLNKNVVVSIISTVLPLTIHKHIIPLLNPRIKLVYNPFFISMGNVIDDFLNPEFVLLGSNDPKALFLMKGFYSTIHGVPCYTTSIVNAELIKVAYNTFIGMKISFSNTLMEICHKIGGNVDEVVNCLKLSDNRLISKSYLDAGMGDGGGCHPRDNIALSWLAKELNLSYDFFGNMMLCREKQTEWLADIIEQAPLPKVILGKSFKPETNITTGSPSILLYNILKDRGVNVKIYDPYVDVERPYSETDPSLFFIGTKHQCFLKFNYPRGSVILDPWGFFKEKDGIEVINIGRF